MNYKIRTIPLFDKQLKRLIKKYPSLKSEMIELIKELYSDPRTGISIGKECYKIRLSIASKSRGKSGGARVITYIAITEEAVFLLSIYDKSEQTTIDNKELLRLIELTNG